MLFAQFSCLSFLIVCCSLHAKQLDFAFKSKLDRKLKPNSIFSRDRIVYSSSTKELLRIKRQTIKKRDPYEIASDKCKEYAEARYVITRSKGIIPGQRTIEYKRMDCVELEPFIANGEQAVLNEYPHMALIGYHRFGSKDEDWSCGGTLISNRYILTAAHCLLSSLGQPNVVRLGDLILDTATDKDKHKDIQIEERIVHPSYNVSSKYHDIALLKLSSDVPLTPDIRPTCLFTLPNAPQKDKVTISGFGITGLGRSKSDRLLKAKVYLLPEKRCNDTFGKRPEIANGYDAKTMICAGDKDAKADTCQGDSGGPIQIKMKSWKCMWSQLGITSFGHYCGIGQPAVYTRIYPYIPWIQSIVWPQG